MEYEKIPIFDFFISRHKVPKSLFSSKLLENDIEELFNSDFILKFGNNSPEKNGKGYSTCGFDSRLITSLSDIDPLFQYISKFVLKYHNSENKKILYTRIWANKIFKNCSGKCHVHNGENDGTAIFYYKCPINGSKLIVLSENIEGLVLDEHKDISFYLEVETGDLVLHDKNVPHAISKHMSDEPRICFIFDYKLI